MSYADALKVKYVAIIGEQELVQGSVNIKDMESGAQSVQSISSFDISSLI